MSATFLDVPAGNRLSRGEHVRFTSPRSGREYRGWVVRVRTSTASHQRGDLITIQLDETKAYRNFYDCEADYEVITNPPRFTARVYDFCGSVIKWMTHEDMVTLEKIVRSNWDGRENAHSFAIVNDHDKIVIYDTI